MVLEVIVLVFAVIFFYYSLRLTVLALDVTNVFAIPKRILYSCMPVAGAIMILYSIRNIAVEIIPLIESQGKQDRREQPNSGGFTWTYDMLFIPTISKLSTPTP